MDRSGSAFVLLFLLFGTSMRPGDGNYGYAYHLDTDLENLIDEFIDEILTCREIVGLNLVVIQGNKTRIKKGYGRASLEEEDDYVGPRTLFGIASLTKAFAATLLGILLEEHATYTWDTPVKEVLGEDFYFSDILRTEKATLKDLLSHRMGVPSNNYARLQLSTREELAKKIRFFDATAEFRGSYIYNNLMYGLVSHISEKIGGDTWENLMQRKLFDPLGMRDTSFTHTTDLSKANMAVPYLPSADRYRRVSWKLHSDWGELGGSGSIISNACDMSRWLRMQLSYGLNNDSRRVAPEQIIKDTHTPVAIVPETASARMYRKPFAPISYTYNDYALAWRHGYYRGMPIVTHTGTSWGYGALLTLIPDLDLAIHTSITGPDTGYKGRRNIHMYIMDLLLGYEPWLNLTTACTFPDATRRRFLALPEGYTAHLPLPDYTGTYGNFGYGNISVVLAANSTRLRLHYGEIGRWELYPTLIAHKFIADGLDDVWSMDLANLWFELEGEEVQRLVIASFESRKPPVFVRGLKMSDAPHPPELCPKAERVVLAPTTSGSGGAAGLSVWIALLTLALLGGL